MSEQFTKDMTFAQAMQANSGTVNVLRNFNLGCVGCMGAQNETLEQGANAHGISVDELLKELNALNA